MVIVTSRDGDRFLGGAFPGDTAIGGLSDNEYAMMGPVLQGVVVQNQDGTSVLRVTRIGIPQQNADGSRFTDVDVGGDIPLTRGDTLDANNPDLQKMLNVARARATAVQNRTPNTITMAQEGENQRFVPRGKPAATTEVF